MSEVDVLVVGGGNAALCAAIAARRAGASVLVLEAVPRFYRGGNTRHTRNMRCAHDAATAWLTGPYPEDEFWTDLLQVPQGETDEELARLMIDRSKPMLDWIQQHGVRFQPSLSGALSLGRTNSFFLGGGRAMLNTLYRTAEALGVRAEYDAEVIDLDIVDGAFRSALVKRPDGTRRIRARCLVAASGGFEANLEWLEASWGPVARNFLVRGTPYNTGDAIRMALAVGAQPWGHWSGCHAVAWDYNAPWHGDRKVGDGFQKHSYPLGIIVNLRGERFVDEGADFRNYTYVKYGRAIIEQPRRAAFQIFDQKVVDLLREEYRIREVTRAEDPTLEGLARKLEIDVDGFVDTVRRFNAAVQPGAFNPAVKDGKGTRGITPPKSNWAQPLDAPPYVGYAVTTGITFTFGGVRITGAGEVLDGEFRPIPGLFAAGELVGGLFYQNYPGGAGLMAGAVFGRIAGRSAARAARGG